MPRSDTALAQSNARFERVAGEPAWSLMRAAQAPTILSILHANFIDSGETRVAAPILIERVAGDLEILRSSGGQALPQTAQQYLASWLDSGWLERRSGATGEEETYELSADALSALRIAQELVTPPRSVTESRLATVMGKVEQLAVDTDPNVETRLNALERERERIDRQISDIRDGRMTVLSADTALERVRDILQLAEQLPADFARVRREVEKLNVQFRRDIIESDGSRGDVLDTLFRGVDLLRENESGRSFNAFYALLVDPERSAGFDLAVDEVLTRTSLGRLSAEERSALRTLIDRLTTRGGEVHDVYVSLARSLRTFVQQREFLEERRINTLIKQAQRAYGAKSTTVNPLYQTGFTLKLSKTQTNSVSQLTITEPDTERPLQLSTTEVEPIDIDRLRALINESDINLFELRQSIDSALKGQTVATISDVLTRQPARQGLGSVIGLLSIGLERAVDGNAVVVDGEFDVVRWNPAGDRARLPMVIFTRPTEENA